MALTRWDPFTTLSRLDQDFDDLVRRAWGAPSQQSRQGGRSRATAGYVPAIDMRAEGADVVVTLELPGVDVEKDVDIEVAEGRLTISGERRDMTEDRDKDGQVLVRELRYGSFRREFALPEGITADNVEATYDKGLLEVRVREVTKPEVPPQKVRIQGVGQQKTLEGHAEPSEG
ncbi:MAG TPA: Hsp20/alpha crystallin family protein [Actinomycetes bacterium]|nr:Hsp20/alpha crystallin family protein [Actinomycetes bacterium]